MPLMLVRVANVFHNVVLLELIKLTKEFLIDSKAFAFAICHYNYVCAWQLLTLSSPKTHA